MSPSSENTVRLARRSFISAASLLVFMTPGGISAGTPMGNGPRAVIQEEVGRAVQARGIARVHVVLEEARPLPATATPAQERGFLGEVAAAQARFRAGMPTRGLSIVRENRWTHGLVADIDAEGLAALRRMPRVKHVYLDGTVHATLAQAVPLIGADAVQASGTTGAGVTVAILDTGINYNHSALGGCFGTGCKVVAGFDYVNNDSDPMDDAGHGTSVAGIVASDGSGAVSVGVAPDADLAALKVLGASGSGTFSDVDSALNWVLTNRTTYNIKAVNMSLGDGNQYNNSGSFPCTGTNTANLIQSLVNADVAVVVSSGNEGYDSGVAFPACVAKATAVGGVYDASLGGISWCGNPSCTTILCTDSVTFADKFVCHTNDGAPLDLLAPDYQTTTTSIGGGTTNFGGTSAAAPFVAGSYALVFEVLPSHTVTAIENTFVSTGVSVTNPDNSQSYPRIDVETAIQAGFDGDLDGILDASDNCPTVYNPGQEDDDLDGVGEACDNCPGLFNDTQADSDGDPSGDACDCDSSNSSVYHGAPQICDGVNNDCSDPNYPSLASESDDDGDGQAECAGDCDDTNPDRYAGNPEVCDGLDNNCDLTVPSNEIDQDSDGSMICDGDCDDTDPERFPGNPEICDGMDNNCDFVVPPEEFDNDSDGFKTCQGDCDDGEPARYPGNPEICDGLDNDCDLVTPVGEENLDGDSFLVCQGDCDDGNAAVYPGAVEVCDGFNNDCNEPSWPSLAIESDDDGDGAAECAGDCDDANPAVLPGSDDVCDGLDNDCDGSTDPGFPFLTSASHHDTVLEPGAASQNRFGSDVIPLPDMNSDGVPDFAAGASGWPAGFDSEGSIRIFSGSDGSSLMLSSDPAGTSPAEMGTSLASPGDVNGDSIADVASGAPAQLVKIGSLNQGRAVMFSGSDGSEIWSFDDQSLPSGARLGTSMTTVVDLTGDGIRELVVGIIKDCSLDPVDCGGSIKILNGAGGQLIRTIRDAADTRNEEFGTSVATIADADGDGDDEVAVGAPLKDLSGVNATGQILLYSTGNGSLLRTMSDPASDPNDVLGTSLASIQDLDGDGVEDILAGAPGRDTAAGVDAGQVLVFSANTGALIRRLEDPNGSAGDAFGSSVTAIPDITKDQVEEILVGAPRATVGGQAGAGKLVLVDGATGSVLTYLEHPSPGAGDGLGTRVAALGSLNGDSVPELAAGIHQDDTADGADAGSIVIFSPIVEGDCDGDGTGNSTDTCTDFDGDGAGTGAFLPPSCALDCDDSSADSYPGAFDICDGDNNDCTDPLYPAVSPDECFDIPSLEASPAAGEVLLDWTVPPGGADSYRIYRGTRADLEGGVNGGFCFLTTATNSIQFDDPVPAETITYYVVAGVRGNLEGSRGLDFFGAERIRGDLCP